MAPATWRGYSAPLPVEPLPTGQGWLSAWLSPLGQEPSLPDAGMRGLCRGTHALYKGSDLTMLLGEEEGADEKPWWFPPALGGGPVPVRHSFAQAPGSLLPLCQGHHFTLSWSEGCQGTVWPLLAMTRVWTTQYKVWGKGPRAGGVPGLAGMALDLPMAGPQQEPGLWGGGLGPGTGHSPSLRVFLSLGQPGSHSGPGWGRVEAPGPHFSD